VVTYEVEITAFGPEGAKAKFKTTELNDVVASIDSVSAAGGVIFVAALTAGRDHGNFYLFRNEAGLAHIMLHEHREHFARDPSVQPPDGVVAFRGELGKTFFVPGETTTSWQRGKAALLHWLPSQGHWPELNWK